MVIGRAHELEHLDEALAAVRPIVVVGPAGVGKTTLCRAALEVRGPHREAGALATLRWAPLLLYRRLLGDAVRDDADRVAAQVLRSATGGLLLDDLQWADELSLEVSGRLAGRVPLLATVRAGDPDAAGAVARLRAAGFELLDLGPLSDDEAAGLLDDRRPDLAAGPRQAVLAQAGGNPLLLLELAGSDPDAPSPTLVRALQARLEEHPPETRVALHRLSVLGRPATPEVVGPGADDLVAAGLAVRRSGTFVEVTHALLAEAVVDQLGAEADAVRRDLAERVPSAEAAFLLAAAGDRASARRTALAAVAEVDRRIGAELLVLAVSCAPEGDLDVEHRMTAAEILCDLGQAERALELCLVDGLEELPSLVRGGLRGNAARAAWLANRPAVFAELIEAALEDARGSRTELEVLVLAGSTYVNTRLDLDGRPALERAREAVALADELGVQQGFARYRLASVLLTSGDPGWADLYRQVLALAEAEGDDSLRMTTYESLVLGEWTAGDIDRAVDLIDDLHRAGAPPDRESAWLAQSAYGALVAVLAGADRTAVVDRWLPLLRVEPLFRNRAYAEAAVVVACADLGRHREAAEVLAAIAGSAHDDPQLASVTGWARVEAAWAAGRPEQAVRAGLDVEALGVGDYPAAASARLVAAHAARDLGEPPRGDEPHALLPAWSGAPLEWQGLVAMATGEHQRAVERFDAAATAWARHDRRSRTRAQWAAAEAAMAGGHPDAVERLAAVEQRAVGGELTDLAARARRSLRSLGTVRSTARAAGVGGLTAREQEVLLLVADGRTSAAIAAELRIATSTVDSLVRSGVRRLGARNRRSAAAAVRRLVAAAGDLPR